MKDNNTKNWFELISGFLRGLLISKVVKDDDSARRIYILNVILGAFFLLTFGALIIWVIVFIWYRTNDHFSPLQIISWIIFLVLPGILFTLTRIGKYKLTAWVLITLLVLGCMHTTLFFGVNVPTVVATYSLIIVISGLVLGPKSAIWLMFVLSAMRVGEFYLQTTGVVTVSENWRKNPTVITDIMIINIVYIIVAIMSWLSSRELDKSFQLVKVSESKAIKLAKELKLQNDNLENIVNERTKELREHQLKELMEINSLAEFGKISAGLLHDIKNPLTVISWNLDSIKDLANNKGIDLKELVDKSLMASKTVEKIIKSSQKQLSNEDSKEKFDLVNEINNVLVLLEHKIQRSNVKVNFKEEKKVIMEGFPVRFSRVIANLIMNSIDSFEKINRKNKIVDIKIMEDNKLVKISVSDNGCGIKDADKKQLFKAFFSTKSDTNRYGLGLNISQKIIQNNFGGDIKFVSEYKKGSIFTVTLPKTNG